MMKSDIDPDVFLSKGFQLRGELSNLGEIVSNERLITIILDEPLHDMYSTIKVQSIRDPDLGLEGIISMIKRSL